MRLLLIFVLLCGVGVGVGIAQQQPTTESLQQQIELLKRQNQEQREMLTELLRRTEPPKPKRKIVRVFQALIPVIDHASSIATFYQLRQPQLQPQPRNGR